MPVHSSLYSNSWLVALAWHTHPGRCVLAGCHVTSWPHLALQHQARTHAHTRAHPRNPTYAHTQTHVHSRTLLHTSTLTSNEGARARAHTHTHTHYTHKHTQHVRVPASELRKTTCTCAAVLLQGGSARVSASLLACCRALLDETPEVAPSRDAGGNHETDGGFKHDPQILERAIVLARLAAAYSMYAPEETLSWPKVRAWT